MRMLLSGSALPCGSHVRMGGHVLSLIPMGVTQGLPNTTSHQLLQPLTRLLAIVKAVRNETILYPKRCRLCKHLGNGSAIERNLTAVSNGTTAKFGHLRPWRNSTLNLRRHAYAIVMPISRGKKHAKLDVQRLKLVVIDNDNTESSNLPILQFVSRCSYNRELCQCRKSLSS